MKNWKAGAWTVMKRNQRTSRDARWISLAPHQERAIKFDTPMTAMDHRGAVAKFKTHRVRK